MAARDKEKYYWLKLDRNFFKRHDISIIESLPNGKEYALFYLKLMCESIDHTGELRFSETLPYNESMLATITNTNIDIVKSALQTLYEFGMIDVMDDRTIFVKETAKLLDGETYGSQRKREYRKKVVGDNVPQLSQKCPQEKEKEKDIEIDIDKDKESKESDFEKFWKCYPKKVGKDDAHRKFQKVKEPLQTLLDAVEKQKNTDQWKRADGRYIPNPATWLNQGRWKDEVKEDDNSLPF